jgi:hypothetical protein
MTKWVADNKARRVPTFVIEATGLDTKKKIVAKFGENAAFDKGKPLPKRKTGAASSTKDAARVIRARSRRSCGRRWPDPRKLGYSRCNLYAVLTSMRG